MTTDHVHESLGSALVQVRERLEDTHGALTRDGLDRETAHTVVEGVHHATSALAGLVGALMEHVPTVATGATDRANAREVVADLRALHGCLTTGLVLLEPTLEDLRGLTAPQAGTATTDDPGMLPAAADGDWVDQHTLLGPDGHGQPGPSTVVADDAAASLQADPVDVLEQQTPVTYEQLWREDTAP